MQAVLVHLATLALPTQGVGRSTAWKKEQDRTELVRLTVGVGERDPGRANHWRSEEFRERRMVEKREITPANKEVGTPTPPTVIPGRIPI